MDFDKKHLPLHISVTPDGNGRWAQRRGFPRWHGHIAGVENFHQISEAAFHLGIPYFTFWAMSEDNFLKRNRGEIKNLFTLLRGELEGNMLKKLMESRIRLRVIGRWEEMNTDPALPELIRAVEKKTAEFSERNLTILLVYSGEREEVETIKKIMTCDGLRPEGLTFEAIGKFSWTKDLPPVDLEIRTGEEKENFAHRSAGFLPYLTANSVLYHTKTLWPDFSEKEFLHAVKEFETFERKFGAEKAGWPR